MTIAITDPHLHLFDPQKGQYTWWQSLSQPDRNVIARDFSISDLVLPSEFNLQGFVHIEAGFDNQASHKEVALIEQKVKQKVEQQLEHQVLHHPLKLGSIGCVDLTQPPAVFLQTLSELTYYNSVRGVRHILDDDGVSILNHEHCEKNLHTLSEHSLAFELQMPLSMAKNSSLALHLLLVLLDKLPCLKVIINHCGLPTSDSVLDDALKSASKNKNNGNQFTYWRRAICKIAQYPNVFIKCSGWEMGNRSYTFEHIKQVTKAVCDEFDEDRIMFASNFPLVLFSTSYATYWQTIYEVTTSLNLNTNKLLNSNAAAIYAL